MKLYLVTVYRVTWGDPQGLVMRDEAECLAAISEAHADWLIEKIREEMADEEPVCSATCTVRELDLARDPLALAAWLTAWEDDMFWSEAIADGVVPECTCEVLAGAPLKVEEIRGRGPRRLTRDQWERERLDVQPLREAGL